MLRRITFVILLSGCTENAEHVWFRSIGGIGNNSEYITWGTAHMTLVRRASVAYADGISKPSGMSRRSARIVSNRLLDQNRSLPDERGLSDWAWQWGQFISHDISLTEPLALAPEMFPIQVPMADPIFDPQATGTRMLPFTRSVYHAITGIGSGNPRQQINQVTSFLDASQVYGSETTREKRLRKNLGDQKELSAWLISSNDTNDDGEYLLPRNIFEAPNCNYGHPQPKHLYLSGDVRVNEVPGLIVLHTVFMREHNRLVQDLSVKWPRGTHDFLFEYARKIVGAQMQVITFQEFLPALLGPYAPGLEGTYDPSLNASISNEFSTVLFRFGHSMIPLQLQKVDEQNSTPISLYEAFFNPKLVARSTDLDSLSKGLAIHAAERVDLKIVGPLRNFLFQGTTGQGLDLAALNIQRGRDHGLPDYNTIRETYGLSRVRQFSEITHDELVQQGLKEVYGSVDDIDAWVGALAEDHLPGASLGPLMVKGMQDAFTRLRDGDRFWFERDPLLTHEEIESLKSTRLSDIIRRNTGASDLAVDLFKVASQG